MPKPSIIQPGRNCWRTARAGRVAYLIDGEAYFSAFVEAARRARHSIVIAGWDMDSRFLLNRTGENPLALGDFLDELARERPELEIHVLDWDFAIIYAVEREALPIFKLGLTTHDSLHFRLDGEHPVGASHHQKIVAIDDAVAFAGGFDLTRCRWDTSKHLANDPRRVDPHGDPYPPFHDAQIMVEGEAALALAGLVRTRWQRATGEELEPAPMETENPWPESVEPDLTDVEVAIARTLPRHKDQDEVREVEQLYLDTIAAAEKWLYFENQYLSSASVAEALAERLREEHGPEVILVLPRHCPGWLEQATMGVLRARLLDRLRKADVHDRLRIYYPRVPALADGEGVFVHAKVLVADDRLARVGSANLSNRSMGFDTECDIAIEATDEKTIPGVVRLRERLLAEHLDVSEENVRTATKKEGSLLRAIESLRGGERTLVPFDESPPEWLDRVIPESEFIDPEKPVEFETLVQKFVPEEFVTEGPRRVVRIALIALVLGSLAAGWRWGPLSRVMDVETLAGAAESVRANWWGLPAVIGAFIAGSLLVVPISLLILASAAAFGPWWGFAYAWAGAMLGAAVSYWGGAALGRERVRELAGRRLNNVSRKLADRGILAMVTVRVIPVAPFTVVNLIAGASHISFRDYALGTLIGMTPGIVLMTAFEQSIEAAVRDPGPWTIALSLTVIAAIVLAGMALRRWIEHPREPETASDEVQAA